MNLNKVFKSITSVMLSVVFLCCICSTGILGILEAEAAMASDISLNGISLSRTAKTGTFIQKVSGDVVDEAYEYQYYDYSNNK